MFSTEKVEDRLDIQRVTNIIRTQTKSVGEGGGTFSYSLLRGGGWE